jgi:hypothetical protein
MWNGIRFQVLGREDAAQPQCRKGGVVDHEDGTSLEDVDCRAFGGRVRSTRHFPACESVHFFARECGQPMSVRAKCQGVS